MARNVSDVIAFMLSTESIELAEVLETRVLLEVPLAGLAAQRASEEDVAELARLVDDLAAVTDDPKRFGDADIEIHRAVARIAGNRLASAFTAWIAEVLLPSVRERIAPAMVEHVIVEQLRALADAIARGDARASEATMHEHLTFALDRPHIALSTNAGAVSNTRRDRGARLERPNHPHGVIRIGWIAHSVCSVGF